MTEVVKPVVDPSTEVTPTTPTEPSPEPGLGNEGEPKNQEDQKDWKAEYDTVKERYSGSSRENDKLKTENTKLEEAKDSSEKELLSIVTESRETFEKYVNSKGFSPEDKEHYMNVYDSQIAPSKLINTPVATETTTDNPTPPIELPKRNPYRENWMNRLDILEQEKFEEQSRASKDFFEDPINKELPFSVRESIKSTAAMLDQEYNYTPADALAAAKKRILDPEAIRNEGYAAGVQDSMTGGISRGTLGGGAKATEQTRLPKKDEAFIQQEVNRKGLNAEAAEKLRKEYAKRLA